jgi:hypothetical protein
VSLLYVGPISGCPFSGDARVWPVAGACAGTVHLLGFG